MKSDSKIKKSIQEESSSVNEKKELEKRLNEVEEKYRFLFENILNGYAYHQIIVDENNNPIDYIILEANEVFEKYTGLKRKDVIGKKVTDIIPGFRDSKPDLIKIFGRVALKGIEEKFDLYFEPFDKWYYVNAYSPQRGYFISVFEDITERKKDEEALIKSKAKFESIFNSITDAIIFTDTERRMIMTNPSFEKIFGYTFEELAGKTTSIIYADSSDYEEQGRQRFNVHKKARTPLYEMDYRRKDGSGFVGETLGTQVTDVSGEVLGYLGVIRDITERKLAEEDLRESEQRFTLALKDSKITVFHQDKKLRYTWVYNPASGLQISSILGKTDEELVPPEDAAQLTEIKRRVLERGISEQSIVRFTVKGQPLFYDLNIEPLSSRDGLIVGIIGISTDVTEQKKMEETLIKVRNLESLGTLAGGIAHDFNNILQAIFGNIQLARMDVAPGDKIYAHLTEAEKAILTAKALARQLLTFSQDGSPIRKIVPISGILKDATAIIPDSSHVSADITTADGLWPVSVDEEQLSQVIENLIKNAVEALPDGGVIKIKAENMVIRKAGEMNLDTGRYVMISVKDEGVGISEEYLEKIFDPYFTTKEMGSQKGLGLGLSIAHSIIYNHEGLITVKSTEGEGTTFFIYIPAVQREGAKQAKAPGREIEIKDKEKEVMAEEVRLLLMDDDDAIRKIASDILRKIGYDVETSGDGNDALSKYKEALGSNRPFDVVILDLTVKFGMGGEETLVKLKKIDPDVRAILSSGYVHDPVMKDFGKYGFKGVLVKPYKIKELEDTLNSVMSC